MDDNVLQHNLDGLNKEMDLLREQERILLKMKGLDETIAEAKRDIADASDQTTGIREEINMLQDERAAAISATANALAEKMNDVLPYGNAVFAVGEDGMFIGWELTAGNVVGYHGLSGGQRVVFDAAFSYALNTDVLIIEAAELDDNNLKSALNKLSSINRQVIVNTCHKPNFTVDGWNIKEF